MGGAGTRMSARSATREQNPTVMACPGRTPNCTDRGTSFTLGPIPCYVGIVSDSLSCVSSVAMVLIYLSWKDIRKRGAQSIVTFIAIADFFTASSYLAGSVNILTYYDIEDCKEFATFCEIESYIVTLAGMSSYLWTIILAFYFYNITSSRKKRREAATKLMPVYHLVAWGIPVLVAFPLLCVRHLQYAPFVGGVWCYYVMGHGSFQPFSQKHVSIAVAVKVPEILAYVIILLLYSATVTNIRRQARTSSNPSETDGLVKVNKILTLIPVLFIILRAWSTVQFIYTNSIAKYNHDGCIPAGLKAGYLTFGILQAIGGGGQGWVNAILYIFLSSTIRKRLFVNPWKHSNPGNIQNAPSTTHFSPPISSNYKTFTSTGLL